jgi:hypothetical protein
MYTVRSIMEYGEFLFLGGGGVFGSLFFFLIFGLLYAYALSVLFMQCVTINEALAPPPLHTIVTAGVTYR